MQPGFTIIETMLFLGITGLIMSFMLVGISTQLNQRRYQDASTSLMTYLQSQYNLVSNVSNVRSSSDLCSNGKIEVTGGTSGPGTSDDCTIVGRLLRSSDAGKTVSAVPVIATVDATLLPLKAGDSDVRILIDANLITALTADEYHPQWGTTLAQPAPDDNLPSNFSILIVRMPTSGVVHTFISTNETASLSDLLNVGNLSSDFLLCLDPSNILGASSKANGVRLKADSANTSGLEYVSQGGC
ncbi:MAG: hypothetical protein ABIP74_00865 [Candidatus Saccharimonas sp.]